MFSLACNLIKNDVEFLPIEISLKKVRVNNADFSTRKNYIEKSTWKQRGFFDQRNYTEKSTWKQRRFFYHQNYIAKSTWKGREFFDQENYIENVRGTDVEICRNLAFDVST